MELINEEKRLRMFYSFRLNIFCRLAMALVNKGKEKMPVDTVQPEDMEGGNLCSSDALSVSLELGPTALGLLYNLKLKLCIPFL